MTKRTARTPGLLLAQFQLAPVPWKGWRCLHEANNRVDTVVSARSLAAVRLHQDACLDRRGVLARLRPGQNHRLALEMRGLEWVIGPGRGRSIWTRGQKGQKRRFLRKTGVSRPPKGLLGSPKSVLGHPKSVSGDPKKVLGHPKGVLGDPGSVSGDPERRLGNPEGLLGNPEGLLGNPKALSGNSERRSGVTEGCPGVAGGGRELAIWVGVLWPQE